MVLDVIHIEIDVMILKPDRAKSFVEPFRRSSVSRIGWSREL